MRKGDFSMQNPAYSWSRITPVRLVITLHLTAFCKREMKGSLSVRPVPTVISVWGLPLRPPPPRPNSSAGRPPRPASPGYAQQKAAAVAGPR